MLKYLCIVLYLFSLNAEVHSRRARRCYHQQKQARGICVLPERCPTYFVDVLSGIAAKKCNSRSICCAGKKIGKKSEKKCKEYGALGFILEKQPILTIFDNEEEEYEKQSICPYEDDGVPVIYGGEKADLGEFPHMALIGFEHRQWKCSGSLISPNFVLSAAHCMFHRKYGNATVVRLGDLNFTDPSDDIHVQEIPIKFTHKHPDYVYPSSYNDIVLFELERAARLSIFVKPICIYTKPVLPREVLATGWGDTETRNDGKNDVLMKVTLNVYEKNMCANSFLPGSREFPQGFDDKIQMCVGSTYNISDTCQGDSGGPIQIRSDKVSCSYQILGITSLGESMCGSKLPAVYVRIYPYIEWIESVIYK